MKYVVERFGVMRPQTPEEEAADLAKEKAWRFGRLIRGQLSRPTQPAVTLGGHTVKQDGSVGLRDHGVPKKETIP